jgi:hypothetical protein
MTREWCKVVLLEEVVDAHTQQLRNQTDMVSVIEPAEEMDTVADSLLVEQQSLLDNVVTHF